MASRVSDAEPSPAGDLHAFAAAVAHEIRTPLSAIAGEVEIALRRDRSAADYREVLQRIGAGIAELVEISGDLTLLSDPPDAPLTAPPSAPLDTILWRIRDRYLGRDDLAIVVVGAAGVRVAGDEERLCRAVTLVLEHATRHRTGLAPVCLRAVAAPGGGVRLLVDAPPSGFWPHAWAAVTGDPRHAGGPLRLRSAQRILDRSGGALRVARASGMDVVHIELPPAA
jgi:signal transduction histidine kinase